MSRDILATELLEAQQHGPGAAAHLVLLAGIVVTGLVILGVIRWRQRRARAERHPGSPDRSEESTPSREEE